MSDNRLKLGFRYEKGSILTRRTIMTGDLQTLLEYEDSSDASLEQYQDAIMEQNCLQKRTESNRRYSMNYLQNLYALDDNELTFRGLRSFVNRDSEFDAQVAALSAYVRDSIYADSFPFIKKLAAGSLPTKEAFEQFIDETYPERFSEKMLQSLVRNLLSSWTQSGHLTGRSKKSRVEVEPTVAAISYALYLGYLKGVRGQNLFLSDYIAFLDCGYDKALELAEIASMRGWLDLKRVGDVIEVRFPSIVTESELELADE